MSYTVQVMGDSDLGNLTFIGALRYICKQTEPSQILREGDNTLLVDRDRSGGMNLYRESLTAAEKNDYQQWNQEQYTSKEAPFKKEWQDSVKECSDEARLRAFAENITVKPEPTDVTSALLRKLRYTEGVESIRRITLQVGEEVVDRVKDLAFFGDRSVPSPADLKQRWSQWWAPQKTPEFHTVYYVMQTGLPEPRLSTQNIVTAFRVMREKALYSIVTKNSDGLYSSLVFWSSTEAWKTNQPSYSAHISPSELQMIRDMIAVKW